MRTPPVAIVICLLLFACETQRNNGDAPTSAAAEGISEPSAPANDADVAGESDQAASAIANDATNKEETDGAVAAGNGESQAVAVADGSSASTGTTAAGLDRETLEARVERAVVKIELFKGKRSMSYGTGFFISTDGLLVTNYHVFSDVLEREHKPIFYLDRSKKNTVEDFEVIRCMDHRDIDLCLLKLPHAPANILAVSERAPEVGDRIFSIGNPKGDDFSHRNGTVTDVFPDIRKAIKINDYTRNRRVELVRVDAELRKGFSGGPVVDLEGNVLGVNSVIMHPPKKGDPVLALAISSKELAKYVAKRSSFDLESFTAKQIRKNTILTTPPEDLSEKQIKKACKTLQKDECIAGIKAACADSKRGAECTRLKAFFKTLL